MNMSRSFPWLVLAVASAYLVAMMAPAEDSAGQILLQEFAKLPREKFLPAFLDVWSEGGTYVVS